jgi:hypothetical protein
MKSGKVKRLEYAISLTNRLYVRWCFLFKKRSI